MIKSGDVSSVHTAIDILINLSNGLTKLSDISRKLGRSKTTVHRIMKTLKSLDIVSQNPLNRQYSLGNSLFSIAYPLVISHQRLTLCALEEMKHLRDFSGETVIIYGRIGNKIVCLEELTSPHDIKYTVGKGSTLPLYAGSVARVFLSELDENEIAKIMRNIELTRFTANSITDKAVLIEKIREAKKQGYAITQSTYTEGTAGITVPLRNYVGPIALSILGPEERLMPKSMDVLKEMKNSAERISRSLLID